MLTSLKQLLFAIADYAGLFPPAQLELSEALTLYDRAQASPHAWMLDRFIVPASRLSELMTLLNDRKPENDTSDSLPLSVIVSKNWATDLENVLPFIGSHQTPQLTIRSLEVASVATDEIQQVCLHLPEEITAFFEIPFNAELEPYLTVLQQTGRAAKLRTGGLTPEAFPSSLQLSQRVLAFAAANILFKATAGLHHPLRSCHLLAGTQADASTPEPSSTVLMHGFLNLALLSAFAYSKSITVEEAEMLLEESTIAAFQFTDTEITWRDRTLSLADIERSRQHFFRSFGSCSFQEPIDDLHHLELL